jgi:hypothetical protein
MGPRVRILSGAVLALALVPTAAIATRPSVSPVYLITGYKGFASERGAKSELVARFNLAGNQDVGPSGGSTYAYKIDSMRLLTDCSPSLVKAPGEIGVFSVTRRKVSQRIHFKYARHGVNIRGYFYGPLGEPSVHATATITRPGCHDALSFTAVEPRPNQQ